MKMKFFPLFRDEGELIASWGEARLIRLLTPVRIPGKTAS
jgi:hypothetical protein